MRWSFLNRLTENPTSPFNYEPPSNRIMREPRTLSGVYNKCSDPQSGISREENLDRWADYAKANSYHGSTKPRREPADKGLTGTEPHPPYLRHK